MPLTRPARPPAAAPAGSARPRRRASAVVVPRPVPPRREAVLRAARPVLAGLAFPAQRWQVLAEADAWGAPGVLRRLLVDLPVGEYADLSAVLEAALRTPRRLR
ncbi:hypothetical protein [Pseudonocardia spirodelae]|uniref:DUF2795 domain-containing protein n=1 Tax=Pseudonocardia spirodelae TaxID=3133431 RepID=A0ABU8T2I0_9PSEU